MFEHFEAYGKGAMYFSRQREKAGWGEGSSTCAAWLSAVISSGYTKGCSLGRILALSQAVTQGCHEMAGCSLTTSSTFKPSGQRQSVTSFASCVITDKHQKK